VTYASGEINLLDPNSIFNKLTYIPGNVVALLVWHWTYDSQVVTWESWLDTAA